MKKKKNYYRIGKADIYIKDAKNMSEVRSDRVNLIITSPPYWNLKDYKSSKQIGFNSHSYEEYINDLNKVWAECVRVLAPDGKICINIMPILLAGNSSAFGRRETRLVITDIENFMRSTGEMYQLAFYIWDKTKITSFSSFGSYPYPPNIFSTYPYEWITVFAKKGKRKPVNKSVKQKSKISKEEWREWAVDSIWKMKPARAKKEKHPAPFPEELPRRLIRLYSFYGDTILDPFLGTGTTVKVALDLARRAIGYEINKEYLSLIRKKINHNKKTSR